jgi:hypothetical protein
VVRITGKELIVKRVFSPRNLATDGLQIPAVTTTNAPLGPVEGKIVLCFVQILAAIAFFP